MLPFSDTVLFRVKGARGVPVQNKHEIDAHLLCVVRLKHVHAGDDFQYEVESCGRLLRQLRAFGVVVRV